MAKRQGVPMHSGHLAGGTFSHLLWSMAQKLPPTERVIPKERKPNGAKERAQAVLTDAQLGAWRHEYENGGISMKGMASKYGVDYKRMYQLLTYCIRESAQGGVVGADPSGSFDSLNSHAAEFCPGEPRNATQLSGGRL